MAKFKKRIKARELRRKGISIKAIAKKLAVSKGSVSLWCRDIELTARQIARLDREQLRGGYRGRLKGVKILKARHLAKVAILERKGFQEVGKMSLRDLFIAGVALYLGEGSKKGHSSVRFSNSDPDIIRLMMRWFRDICLIPEESFRIYISINAIHKSRLEEVKSYWSRETEIPINQFGKPIILNVKNKKVYENIHQYFGTLSVRITKSSEFFYRIQGYIKALCNG